MEEKASMADQAYQLSNQLVQWRRWIHANPELSFQEYNTAQFVAQILSTIPGMDVVTNVAKTGVVGTLSAGLGATIALRADMDALPIEEINTHNYRSLNAGVMHACGHDAHTSILLGVAHLLGEKFQKGELQGTVKFIFQPAEEDPDENGYTGASYLVEEGVLDGCDIALALHVDPEYPVGSIRIHDNYSMANVDIFEGKIQATGGHAAYPHLGQDSIWMLAQWLQIMHGIVSRKVSPLEPAVVSVTQIEAGTASNVLPTEIVVRGTLRSYHPEVREHLIAEVEKAFAVIRHLGGNYECKIQQGEPALKNDPVINRWLRQTITDQFPSFQLVEQPFGLGGEDFGFISREIPSAMFFLGCAISDGVKRDLHTPIFDIDESCLPIGAAILAETASRYLKGEYSLRSANLIKD